MGQCTVVQTNKQQASIKFPQLRKQNLISEMTVKMSSETLCLYNKFGLCKFRETCHHQHCNEVCEETNCEIRKCLKRHPRNCRFFDDFRCCKFGEYCSFSHKSLENDATENELSDVKARLVTLEDVVMKQKIENECVNSKLNRLEIKKSELETELRNSLQQVKVSEIVVKEAIETVVAAVSKQQDDMENRNEARMNSLRHTPW